MNKLNRRVEYSLMALKFLNSKPFDKVTAKEVAEQLHTSFEVVARVLQVLAQKGILISEQGASGGYRLVQNLDQLSLHQLVEHIEGPSSVVKCISEVGVCEIQDSCNIVPPMKALNEKVNNFYKTISVLDLIQETHHV
jgi:Rrf2 family protein